MHLEQSLEKYAYDNRLKTFKKGFKVKGAPKCTTENFAKAGFYSVGTKQSPDLVKCFACKRELGDWEPEDDPWQEHMRRGTNCPFVALGPSPPSSITLEQFLNLHHLIQIQELRSEAEEAIKSLEIQVSERR